MQGKQPAARRAQQQVQQDEEDDEEDDGKGQPYLLCAEADLVTWMLLSAPAEECHQISIWSTCTRRSRYYVYAHVCGTAHPPLRCPCLLPLTVPLHIVLQTMTTGMRRRMTTSPPRPPRVWRQGARCSAASELCGA